MLCAVALAPLAAVTSVASPRADDDCDDTVKTLVIGVVVVTNRRVRFVRQRPIKFGVDLVHVLPHFTV